MKGKYLSPSSFPKRKGDVEVSDSVWATATLSTARASNRRRRLLRHNTCSVTLSPRAMSNVAAVGFSASCAGASSTIPHNTSSSRKRSTICSRTTHRARRGNGSGGSGGGGGGGGGGSGAPLRASEEGGGWNTLGGGTSTDSGDARSQDGWVSEDAEPQPPPASQVDEYERDKSGRMVYVPRGYYYDGVRPSDEGDRIKVDVGVVGSRRQRTFALRKVLSSSSSSASSSTSSSSTSDIFESTMEKPLGIVFERDTEGRVRVADFIEGSRAGRAAAVQRMQGGVNNATVGPGPGGVGAAAKRGDVLRACTTTTLSFGPRAQLLGDLSGTKRAVVLFGCDGQPWNKTVGALTAGLVADGPVTLLLERARDEARANAWTPEELEREQTNAGKMGSAAGRRDLKAGARARAGGGSGGRRRTAGGGGRRRVEDESNVPDAINGAFLVSGISFLLLIAAGFNP
jgi:hypothetical protein